jgi:hypothetical protein
MNGHVGKHEQSISEKSEHERANNVGKDFPGVAETQSVGI